MTPAQARLDVSRHACVLFWERGLSGTSGDDIAAAAGLSTRTIWRYFRSKEACVEPVLAKSAHRFIGTLDRWPPELSLGEHIQNIQLTIGYRELGRHESDSHHCTGTAVQG